METPLVALGQKDSFSDLPKKLSVLNDQELTMFYPMLQSPDVDTKIGRETVLRLSEEMQVDAQYQGDGSHFAFP